MYIFMFLYHKIIWIISTLRSKHVYFDKTVQTYTSSPELQKQNFCNTNTLNLSEHRSVSVCAPLPPPPLLPFCSCLLHLLLPSINLQFVSSFIWPHLVSVSSSLSYVTAALYQLTSRNIFIFPHPVYYRWVCFCFF